MGSESSEIQSPPLSQAEVKKHSKAFLKTLAKKLSYLSNAAAAVIDGRTEQGIHSFPTTDYEYLVERQIPPTGGEVILSVTRFSKDINSPVVSEGMRFVSVNPGFTTKENVIEYQIHTKEAPETPAISNDQATITEGNLFLESIK